MPGIKRYKIPKLGALKEILSQTVFWMSIVNFTLIGLTAYNTTLKIYIIEYIPWMQAWMFILLLFTLLIIAMFIEYKFIMPSYYAFRGKQYSQHSEWSGEGSNRSLSEVRLRQIIKEELNERDRNNLPSKTSKEV